MQLPFSQSSIIVDTSSSHNAHVRTHSRIESVGSGLRGWFGSGRSDREQIRRESISSSSSGPKTPVLSQAQEMGRIETVLTESVGSQQTSNLQFSPSPTSPISSPNTPSFTNDIVTMPQRVAAVQSMEFMVSAQNLSVGGNEELQPRDIEMQRQSETRSNKRWWWQKPRWKSVQHRLVTLSLAGFILTVLVAIYLGLALCKRTLRQEWHVLLILVILVSTVFFCHSLVRLCIDVINPAQIENGPENFARIPSIAGPGGYANPMEPIRINTQNLEEIEGAKEPPPVYGLWRCSVRVNPDQFFWARQENTNQAITHNQRVLEESESPTQGPRPPSYISDDGVSYAVNAVLEVRTEAPLPPHPSELHRLP